MQRSWWPARVSRPSSVHGASQVRWDKPDLQASVARPVLQDRPDQEVRRVRRDLLARRGTQARWDLLVRKGIQARRDLLARRETQGQLARRGLPAQWELPAKGAR